MPRALIKALKNEDEEDNMPSLSYTEEGIDESKKALKHLRETLEVLAEQNARKRSAAKIDDANVRIATMQIMSPALAHKIWSWKGFVIGSVYSFGGLVLAGLLYGLFRLFQFLRILPG